jgi:hypothetical protein
MIIFIKKDGITEGLVSPVTQLLQLGNIKRVSHIEPVNSVLRWLFHLIRCRVKDTSYLAAFTRYWPCQWRANIIGGPIIGPFKRRKDAIAAEILWINFTLGE